MLLSVAQILLGIVGRQKMPLNTTWALKVAKDGFRCPFELYFPWQYTHSFFTSFSFRKSCGIFYGQNVMLLFLSSTKRWIIIYSARLRKPSCFTLFHCCMVMVIIVFINWQKQGCWKFWLLFTGECIVIPVHCWLQSSKKLSLIEWMWLQWTARWARRCAKCTCWWAGRESSTSLLASLISASLVTRAPPARTCRDSGTWSSFRSHSYSFAFCTDTIILTCGGFWDG